jgi:hypothetical protein
LYNKWRRWGRWEKRRNIRKVQIFRSENNLDISFVDSNPQYNKNYLMLREMRQDVV